MRPLTILAVVAVLGDGCTHTALERRTVKQASTLTDLQHQQVLDNLAAITCNPDALPWHIKIKGGLVQVADQGNVGFEAALASGISNEVKNLFTPSVAGQRGVVGQWELDPTTEAEELELLRSAYRKATDPANPEVNAEIYKTIGQLSVRFDILPKQEVRRQIFLTNDILATIKRRQDELDKLIPQLAGDVGTLPTEESKSGADVANRQRQNDLVAVLRRNVQEKYELEQMTKLVDEDLKATAATGSPRLGITGTQVLESSRPMRNTVTDNTGGQKQQVVNQPAGQKTLRLAAIEMSLGSYVPSQELREASQRNVGLIAQAEDKIRKLEDLVEKFNTPWLVCGKKHDVPKCACYVGRHRGCTGDCHVWVMPDQLGTLREFTLIVLALAPIEKQELFPSRGAAFSPSFR